MTCSECGSNVEPGRQAYSSVDACYCAPCVETVTRLLDRLHKDPFALGMEYFRVCQDELLSDTQRLREQITEFAARLAVPS